MNFIEYIIIGSRCLLGGAARTSIDRLEVQCYSDRLSFCMQDNHLLAPITMYSTFIIIQLEQVLVKKYENKLSSNNMIFISFCSN